MRHEFRQFMFIFQNPQPLAHGRSMDAKPAPAKTVVDDRPAARAAPARRPDVHPVISLLAPHLAVKLRRAVPAPGPRPAQRPATEPAAHPATRPVAKVPAAHSALRKVAKPPAPRRAIKLRPAVPARRPTQRPAAPAACPAAAPVLRPASSVPAARLAVRLQPATAAAAPNPQHPDDVSPTRDLRSDLMAATSLVEEPKFDVSIAAAHLDALREAIVRRLSNSPIPTLVSHSVRTHSSETSSTAEMESSEASSTPDRDEVSPTSKTESADSRSETSTPEADKEPRPINEEAPAAAIAVGSVKVKTEVPDAIVLGELVLPPAGRRASRIPVASWRLSTSTRLTTQTLEHSAMETTTEEPIKTGVNTEEISFFAQRVATGRSHRYKCTGCEFQRSDRHAVNAHIEEVHLKHNPRVCHCGYRTHNDHYFARHQLKCKMAHEVSFAVSCLSKRVPGNDGQKACHCGYKTYNERRFTVHQRKCKMTQSKPARIVQ